MQNETKRITPKRKPREEKRPSCDRCRGQKLKCDAYLDLSRPCTRCRGRNAECNVPAEHIQKARYAKSYNNPQQSGSDGLPVRTLEEQQNSIASFSNVTNPFELGGISVDVDFVKACFQQYQDRYFPLLPTIVINGSPKKILGESPLKFWAIVCIGSRRLPEPLNLYTKLQPAVLDLALESIGSPPTKSFQVIEGLVLVCSWHLVPGHLLAGSVSFVLSNVAYSKAQQIGLDPKIAPPRARDSLLNHSIQDDTSRKGMMLWAQTLLTHQVSMLCSGLILESSRINSFWNNALASENIPRPVALQGKLLSILMDTAQAAGNLGLERQEEIQYEALKEMLSVVESQITDMKDRLNYVQDLIDDFYFHSALLHIHVFVFHAKPEDQSSLDLMKLYDTTTMVLNIAKNLDDIQGFVLYSPYYVLHSILLAATAIRRLVALESIPEVMQTANSYYDLSLVLCGRISVAEGDLARKCQDIISWLWNSPKLYKHPDGTPKLDLQIRNRLSASILFDATFWYRESTTNPDYLQTPAPMNITQGSEFLAEWLLDSIWTDFVMH